MHKPIHERYHYGNERYERDMTRDEFFALFERELNIHDVRVYVGEHGASLAVPRFYDPYSILGALVIHGRLEYGWSTFTINEDG